MYSRSPAGLQIHTMCGSDSASSRKSTGPSPGGKSGANPTLVDLPKSGPSLPMEPTSVSCPEVSGGGRGIPRSPGAAIKQDCDKQLLFLQAVAPGSIVDFTAAPAAWLSSS